MDERPHGERPRRLRHARGAAVGDRQGAPCGRAPRDDAARHRDRRGATRADQTPRDGRNFARQGGTSFVAHGAKPGLFARRPDAFERRPRTRGVGRRLHAQGPHAPEGRQGHRGRPHGGREGDGTRGVAHRAHACDRPRHGRLFRRRRLARRDSLADGPQDRGTRHGHAHLPEGPDPAFGRHADKGHREGLGVGRVAYGRRPTGDDSKGAPRTQGLLRDDERREFPLSRTGPSARHQHGSSARRSEGRRRHAALQRRVDDQRARLQPGDSGRDRTRRGALSPQGSSDLPDFGRRHPSVEPVVRRLRPQEPAP